MLRSWLLSFCLRFFLCNTGPNAYLLELGTRHHLGDHVPTGSNGHLLPPSYAYNVVSTRCQLAFHNIWRLLIRIVGQQHRWVLKTFHTLPITFAKLSVLFFYRRISKGAAFSLVDWVAIGLASTWGIAFFFVILFECVPVGPSFTHPAGGPGIHCINQVAAYQAMFISDVIIDFLVLAIPSPFIWRLHMSIRQKIEMSTAFGLGGL